MKKILISFTAIAICVAAYSQTTVPSGAISGTWNLAGSPYLIEGFTFVLNGSTLTIEAGTTVEWQGSYTMYIYGQVVAIGTTTDSILFTAADHETGFKSIRFIETDPENDTSRFEYCIFEYGNAYGYYPDNSGGAIALKSFSKVIFDHCLFRNNQAVEPHAVTENSCGGAIVVWDCSPQIRNCAFINNRAYSGGAILCFEGADPLIENNTFKKNRAIEFDYGQGYGGAICSFVDCDPVISNNIFTENYAENGGGALAFVLGCNPVIDHNLFYNDTASWGGAIELQDNSIGQIINNTIANNYADGSGGAIDCWTKSVAHVWNSILWENTSPYSSQVNLSEPTDVLHIHYSDLMGGLSSVEGEGSVGTWEGMIDEDPLFEGSDTCYYHLMESSPCIDAGDPECTDTIDGTTCDMGAFWCNYLHVGISDPGFQVPGSGFQVEVWPNPAGRIVDCQLSIVDCRRVSLKIFDLFGREVRSIVEEVRSPGENTFRIDVSGLPAGVYLVRVQAGEESAVRKLVVQ